MKTYYVYILANKRNGTLYVGVTNNIARRLYEHKEKLVEGFSKQYDTKRLVYLESTSNVQTALNREKQLKWWRRSWKLELIERDNPRWLDLSKNLFM